VGTDLDVHRQVSTREMCAPGDDLQHRSSRTSVGRQAGVRFPRVDDPGVRGTGISITTVGRARVRPRSHSRIAGRALAVVICDRALSHPIAGYGRRRLASRDQGETQVSRQILQLLPRPSRSIRGEGHRDTARGARGHGSGLASPADFVPGSVKLLAIHDPASRTDSRKFKRSVDLDIVLLNETEKTLWTVSVTWWSAFQFHPARSVVAERTRSGRSEQPHVVARSTTERFERNREVWLGRSASGQRDRGRNK
jgi:hypothetical protein